MQTTNKDNTESYKAHNKEYETVSDIAWCQKHYDEYNKENLFSKMGFEEQVKLCQNKIKNHIDIGSGAGWLTRKTAPYFTKIIGIEPSKAAVDTARKLNSDITNIEFLNIGMIEYFTQERLEEPYFVTTSTVLSHIDNKITTHFLELLNQAPYGSRLYFGEPYGKNRYQYLWFVRSQEWWAKKLPNWQLTFSEIKNGRYLYGISGEAVGVENVKSIYKMGIFRKIYWTFTGTFSFIKRVARLIIKK